MKLNESSIQRMLMLTQQIQYQLNQKCYHRQYYISVENTSNQQRDDSAMGYFADYLLLALKNIKQVVQGAM